MARKKGQQHTEETVLDFVDEPVKKPRRRGKKAQVDTQQEVFWEEATEPAKGPGFWQLVQNYRSLRYLLGLLGLILLIGLNILLSRNAVDSFCLLVGAELLLGLLGFWYWHVLREQQPK